MLLKWLKIGFRIVFQPCLLFRLMMRAQSTKLNRIIPNKEIQLN